MKNTYKWLVLMSVLLLSGCSLEEPLITSSSNDNSSAIEKSSLPEDVLSNSAVLLPEESSVNYAFPFVGKKEWEQGDYKINVVGDIEKRSENDQDIVFSTLSLAGEQNFMMGTDLPQLAQENAQSALDILSSYEGYVTSPSINGSIEVEGYFQWAFLNDMYGVWQFHLDRKKTTENDYDYSYYDKYYSFTLLDKSLWRSEVQLDVGALKDARTLPAAASWNPLSEQYIVVYGVGDPVYRHTAYEYGMEGDIIYTSDSKNLMSGNDSPPIYRLAVATFDGQGKLLKEITLPNRYLNLFFKGDLINKSEIQILSDHELLLYRNYLQAPEEEDADNSYNWLYVNLETEKACIVPELMGDISNFNYNIQKRELLSWNDIFAFSEDGTSSNRRIGMPLIKLEEQNGRTALVPAKAYDDAFKAPKLVPYSAVRRTAWGPIKIPGMPMLNKTDLYYSVEKENLILLMKYPWAQPEKAEVAYGFQYCSKKCEIKFTYVDQDGTVYIKHQHDKKTALNIRCGIFGSNPLQGQTTRPFCGWILNALK